MKACAAKWDREIVEVVRMLLSAGAQVNLLSTVSGDHKKGIDRIGDTVHCSNNANLSSQVAPPELFTLSNSMAKCGFCYLAKGRLLELNKHNTYNLI